MIITEDILSRMVGPKNMSVWVDAFNSILPEYGIDNKMRIAAFLAQCAHESAGFNILKENLNYSADGLRATFPKYFPTQALADQYARLPPKIASRVYANRMGNGDEASCDGWTYRGHGIIQITGKSNYAALSQALFGDDHLLESPVTLIEPIMAVKSACWFWNTNHLNDLADKGDMLAITKRINGGTKGLADRLVRYNKLMVAM